MAQFCSRLATLACALVGVEAALAAAASFLALFALLRQSFSRWKFFLPVLARHHGHGSFTAEFTSVLRAVTPLLLPPFLLFPNLIRSSWNSMKSVSIEVAPPDVVPVDVQLSSLRFQRVHSSVIGLSLPPAYSICSRIWRKRSSTELPCSLKYSRIRRSWQRSLSHAA